MKLYVYDKNGEKVYIEKHASTKRELGEVIGTNKFSINKILYNIKDVKAEVDAENTAASMVIGGTIGLLGGVPGVILGGIAGGILGKKADEKQNQLVDKFNKSEFYE